MNKFFTKIAAATLGVALAIGVGIAVNHKSDAKETRALSGTNGTYVLVESALTDWSGKYLIYGTSSNTSRIWDASSTVSDAGTYVGSITVTNKKIVADTSYEWTIASMTGGYSIKSQSANDPYITDPSSSNGVATNASAQANAISWNANGYVEIKGSTRYLRDNAGYFRFYKTQTQGSPIQLFKKIEGETVTFETNTPSYLKNVGQSVTLSATASNSATVSYESSNTDVATINAETGELSAVGVGTTTITASAQGATSAELTFKVLSAHTGLTQGSPLTVTEAQNYYNNLTGDEKTASYYITGTVSEIDTTYDDYYLDDTNFSFYHPSAGEGVDLSDVLVGSVVIGYGSMTATSGGTVYSNGPTIKSVSNPSYTVSFNANSGSGSMDSVSDVFGYYELPDNDFTAPTGKEFAGWKAENAGDLLAVGDNYLVKSNVTFYAQWDSVSNMGWTGTSASQFVGIAGTTQLTKTITDTWSVSATWESGKTDSDLKFGDYTLRIGDTKAINELPYTWQAEDNGKQLYVIYHGFAKANATAKPSLIEHLNSIKPSIPITGPYAYTFTGKVYEANGSKVLADTNQKLENVTWTLSGDGEYWGYDGTKGQQLGSGNDPYKTMSLSTSDIPGTITSVTVNTSGASSVKASVSISVGTTNFTCDSKTSASITGSATNYAFTGSASGGVTISWTQTSSKALYLKSISINYSGNLEKEFANQNYNAQKAALEYAKDFNDTMACVMAGGTENIESKWETVTAAFSTKRNTLTETTTVKEKTAFNNLFKYAVATTRNEETGEADTGDSLQNMLARYDYIVRTHGVTDFLHEDSGVARDAVLGSRVSVKVENAVSSNNAALIAIVITSISLITLGGLLLLKKRKEQ